MAQFPFVTTRWHFWNGDPLNRIEGVYPYFKKAQLLNFLQHAHRKADIMDLMFLFNVDQGIIDWIGGGGWKVNTGSPSQWQQGHFHRTMRPVFVLWKSCDISCLCCDTPCLCCDTPLPLLWRCSVMWSEEGKIFLQASRTKSTILSVLDITAELKLS